jgi:uncharacterized protein YidB (DUF937 family)
LLVACFSGAQREDKAMGLLDSVMGSFGGVSGQPAQRPGLGSTVAAGVVLALLAKGVRSFERSRQMRAGEDRSFDPAAPGQDASLGAGQGGMLGGLGGLLGGLGGAGALGALVSHFQNQGLGSQVSSWVGTGQNAPVSPNQLAEALGENNLAELQQHTGLSRESLLSELAQHLPDAVHELTPEGRVPEDIELRQIVTRT